MYGYLFVIHCKDWVEILEVKLTEMWCPPIIGSSWEFLTLRIAHTENPAICLGFPTPAPAPSEISVLVSYDSLYLPLSSVLGVVNCFVTSLLGWIQEWLLIFQFCFLFIWMEWGLLSSLHTGLEVSSLYPFIFVLFATLNGLLG